MIDNELDALLGKDENSAYCVHCKIRYGDLQNVGSQV